MKILLVEDDVRTAEFVLKGLKQAGYTTVHAADGEDGLFKAINSGCDLVVLDVMLPKLNGLQLISRLRGSGSRIPVIILSARGSVDDRVEGLRLGGDDYLAKPFNFAELLARISALLRRSSETAESPGVLSVGELTLDLKRRKASRNGIDLDLQPLEFNVLEYLARNAGRVVSKTMLMEHVWEYNFDPRTNIVETRVCRLREKLDKPFDRELLHTVRGFGYILDDGSGKEY